MDAFQEKLQDLSAMTEHYLAGLFTQDVPWKELLESMRYSLLAGGKRLRPLLCLAFCEAAGGRAEDALSAAAAIELVHTFSLIHDDLPCMDDGELRRGKPTNHRVYGEAMATLAGDALLTAAFRLLAQMDAPPECALKCVEYLACAAGEDGMGAGQALDLRSCETAPTKAEVLQLHDLKTGAMIRAACQMGALLGGGTPEQVAAAGEFGASLGLAYQIRDDILDRVGSEAELGKHVGQDEKNGKTTFVTLLGLEESRAEVVRLTQSAVALLRTAQFGETGFLERLARSLLSGIGS